VHAHWREQKTTQSPCFLTYLRENICLPPVGVLSSRSELSSWPADEDWGKLGHQSSANTRLLDCPYHLSANTISRLPCCIYTAEGCCHGNMLWWLFDVTCLRRGNRLASVKDCWGMRRLGSGEHECVRVCVYVCVSSFSFSLTLIPFSLSCLNSYFLFHANILEHSSSLCMSYCVFGFAPLSPFWKIKQIYKRRTIEGKKSQTTPSEKESWKHVRGLNLNKVIWGDWLQSDL